MALITISKAVLESNDYMQNLQIQAMSHDNQNLHKQLPSISMACLTRSQSVAHVTHDHHLVVGAQRQGLYQTKRSWMPRFWEYFSASLFHGCYADI